MASLLAGKAALTIAKENPQLIRQGMRFAQKNPNLLRSMSPFGSPTTGGTKTVPMIIAFFMAVYSIVILSILVYDAKKIRKHKKKSKQHGYVSASIFSAITASLIMLMYVFKKYIGHSTTTSIIGYLISAVLTVVLYFTIIAIADMKSVNGRNGLYFLFYILGLTFSIIPPFL
jgi:archaellum biogenesis protein FlaJ (TadC family)